MGAARRRQGVPAPVSSPGAAPLQRARLRPHLPRSRSRRIELHSAAILLVWLRQSASWPRSRGSGGRAPACGAAAAASSAPASAFLRRPILASWRPKPDALPRGATGGSGALTGLCVAWAPPCSPCGCSCAEGQTCVVPICRGASQGLVLGLTRSRCCWGCPSRGSRDGAIAASIALAHRCTGSWRSAAPLQSPAATMPARALVPCATACPSSVISSRSSRAIRTGSLAPQQRAPRRTLAARALPRRQAAAAVRVAAMATAQQTKSVSGTMAELKKQGK